MRAFAERAYFAASLAFGRLLRSARYATTQIVHEGGERFVRKRRSFHAPLLIVLSGPLTRALDTGVRVLPQREWAEREHSLHASLRGTSIRVEDDGSLVLPLLAGETLASLLGNRALAQSARRRALGSAVVALAELHARGVTHGDAMDENVLVDIEAGVAHWFDFETVHEPDRSLTWRRADDVRALLTTCLLRTVAERRAETLDLILDAYADEEVARALATNLTSVLRRPLPFHLGQAPLSFESTREIGRLLRARVGR